MKNRADVLHVTMWSHGHLRVAVVMFCCSLPKPKAESGELDKEHYSIDSPPPQKQFPTIQTDRDIQKYSSPYRQMTSLQDGTPARKKLCRGEFWAVQAEPTPKVWPTPRFVLHPPESESWLMRSGINSFLIYNPYRSLRCLWHFVNWPLVDVRWGSPESAASNKKTLSW